jgi:fructoselysine-6-P-deglycase FrlB-like protein
MHFFLAATELVLVLLPLEAEPVLRTGAARTWARSTALFFLPIAVLLAAKAAKKRLVAPPDPRHHRLARVMQSILN